MGDFTIGRIGRQMLAVGALSFALIAAVLAFGGLALSHLGLTTPPVPAATSGAAGVYRIATPSATPFATPQPRAHKTYVAAPPTATVAFRPAVATTAPRSRPSARVRARVSNVRKPRTKKRAVRRHRTSRPAPAAVTASVASATPAPAIEHAAKKPQKATPPGHARRATPNVSAPAPAVAHPPAARGPKPKTKIPPGQAKKLTPVAAAPAPPPAAAPPAHANNGRGHGAQGPAGPKAHGRGH